MTTKKSGGSQADGTRRSYFTYDPFEIVIIGIDTDDGPEHPLFDAQSNAYKAEDDEAMIANVRTFGVLKPMLFERDGDRIIAVDGRTRVRWARCAARIQKQAGEEILKVPAIPKRGDGAYLYGVSRAANTHRPDDGPLERARNAQRLMDMGRSELEVAIAFGVDVKTLARQWLPLLGLAPQLQKAVERGAVRATAASALAKLSRADQVAKLEELTAGGAKPTTREATNKVREVNGQAPTETPSARLKKIVTELRGFDPATHDPHRLIAQLKAHAGMDA